MGREVPPAPNLDSALMLQVQKALLDRHYSKKTQRAFQMWIERFLASLPERPLATLREADLRAFLESLANDDQLTPVARNQARAALLLFFHGVLGLRTDCTDGMVHTPVQGGGLLALSRDEVRTLLARIDPAFALMAALLYGAGLRPNELLLLRVRDVDLPLRALWLRDQREIRSERWALLPERLAGPLEDHLAGHRERHQSDLAQQAGLTAVPESVRLAQPDAARAWQWQWLFPVSRINWDLRTHSGHRPHHHEAPLLRAIQAAARSADITKPINSHTLRHSFRVHLVAAGEDPEVVDALLGVPSTSAAARLGSEAILGANRKLRSPLDQDV
jgi:integrase